MYFYWLKDCEAQNYFQFFSQLGKFNTTDYWTTPSGYPPFKHPTPNLVQSLHHRETQAASLIFHMLHFGKGVLNWPLVQVSYYRQVKGILHADVMNTKKNRPMVIHHHSTHRNQANITIN